jgi:hypothetical protein
MDIARQRLRNQRIEPATGTCAVEVVAALGAVQAQDYLGGLWAIGLRLRAATEASIEAALAARRIVRSWPLRGTLHFAAAADLRWMLALAAPRVLARARTRLKNEFALDEAEFARSAKVIEGSLRGGQALTRPALYQRLQAARIVTDGQRGLHILWWLAQQGLICFGVREGRQQTFVLLEEWLPPSKPLQREDALAELARRYFVSRGPATAQDFTWWSGLAPADARAALDAVRDELQHETVDGATFWFDPGGPPDRACGVHLLSAWDEYAVAYKDRSHVLASAHAARAGNGIFKPVIVVDGRIAGTWTRRLGSKTVAITSQPFTVFEQPVEAALAHATRCYARFVGLPLAISPR